MAGLELPGSSDYPFSETAPMVTMCQFEGTIRVCPKQSYEILQVETCVHPGGLNVSSTYQDTIAQFQEVISLSILSFSGCSRPFESFSNPKEFNCKNYKALMGKHICKTCHGLFETRSAKYDWNLIS